MENRFSGTEVILLFVVSVAILLRAVFFFLDFSTLMKVKRLDCQGFKFLMTVCFMISDKRSGAIFMNVGGLLVGVSLFCAYVHIWIGK